MNAQTANSSVVLKKVNHFKIKRSPKQTLEPSPKPIDYLKELRQNQNPNKKYKPKWKELETKLPDISTKDYVELVKEESKELNRKASQKEMMMTHMRHQDYTQFNEKNKEVNDLLVEAIHAKLAILDKLM